MGFAPAVVRCPLLLALPVVSLSRGNRLSKFSGIATETPFRAPLVVMVALAWPSRLLA